MIHNLAFQYDFSMGSYLRKDSIYYGVIYSGQKRASYSVTRRGSVNHVICLDIRPNKNRYQ